MRKYTTLNCDYCNKLFKRLQYRVNKEGNNFCCNLCRIYYIQQEAAVNKFYKDHNEKKPFKPQKAKLGYLINHAIKQYEANRK